MESKNSGVKISMKKNKVLIIALIISLVFGFYTFFTQEQQKQSANEIFINCLNEADACFAVPYSKFGEEDKVYYYMKASANLIQLCLYYLLHLMLMLKIKIKIEIQQMHYLAFTCALQDRKSVV